MKHHDFDREVRKKALMSSDSFDMEKMWATVEPQVKRKRKRRPVFIWFLFGGMLLLGGLAYFNGIGLQPDEKRTATNFDKSASNEVSVIDRTKYSHVSHISSQELQEITLDTPLSDIVEVDEDKSKINVTDESKLKPEKVSAQEKQEYLAIDGSAESQVEGENSDDNLAGNTSNNTYANTELDQSKETFNPMKEGAKTKEAVSVTLIPSKALKNLHFKRSLDLPALGWMSIKKQENEKVNLPKLIAVSSSYYKMSNSFAFNEGGDEEVYRLRNSQEKPLDAFDLNLTYTQNLSERFALEAGFRYAQEYRSRSAMTIQSKETQVSDYLIAQQVSLNGISEQRIDTLIKTTTRYQEDTYLTYTSVGLRLGGRYTFKTKRWGFGLRTGIESILSSHQSGWISQENWRYDIGEDEDEIYRQGFRANVYSGLLLSYDLTQRFSLALESNLVVPMHNRYAESYSIKERNILYGLGLGLSMNL